MLDLCEAHGITYVQGDIQADGTWRGIEAALGGRRADLVLERGIAGLNRIEFTTRRYVRWLSRIWDFTTEQGGLIALGLPHVAGPKKSVPGIVEALVRE